MKIHIFPFQIGKNVMGKIWLVEFTSFWYDVEQDWFASSEENRYHSLLRPDGLPRPWNDVCRQPCNRFED
jgi:hypothetical protein